jgi:hypothetical protein
MAEPETAAEAAPPPGITARAVIRAAATAALATALPPDGRAYGSLVLAAVDHDATPLLLISRLAEHTRNIAADPRLSLLFDGTAGHEDPLTGPRVSLLGRAAPSAEPRHRARFLARHPGAARYADFGDFAFYRVEVERAHLVAGFGRIHWLERGELLYAGATAALAEAEAAIVAHMNEEHADAVQLYAAALLGKPGGGWRLTGCDPEGVDLRRGGETARLAFAHPVADAEGARAELVRLVKAARGTAKG